jgi:hypothetical protein
VNPVPPIAPFPGTHTHRELSLAELERAIALPITHGNRVGSPPTSLEFLEHDLRQISSSQRPAGPGRDRLALLLNGANRLADLFQWDRLLGRLLLLRASRAAQRRDETKDRDNVGKEHGTGSDRVLAL